MTTFDAEQDDRDPRLARVGLIAGLVSLPLAPLVVGLLPAAIALHASLSHLRFRQGHRMLAGSGAALGFAGALLSTASALVWGALLLGVLLSRSAVRQARGWENLPIGEFRFTTIDGTTIAPDDLRGDVALIDVFSVASPHCRVSLTALRDFARRDPSVRILSWAPDDGAAEVDAFLAPIGTTHAIAIGGQRVDEPLSLVSAKPTLFVIDAKGVVRHVLLGTYDVAGLERLVEAARGELAPVTPTAASPAR